MVYQLMLQVIVIELKVELVDRHQKRITEEILDNSYLLDCKVEEVVKMVHQAFHQRNVEVIRYYKLKIQTILI